MNLDDFDPARLAEIPDPYARSAGASPPPVRGGRMDASPTRGRVRDARAAALAVALLSELAWLTVVEHRADLSAVSRVELALGVAIPLAAAALALGATVRRGALGLGVPAQRLALVVAASLAIFVVGTVAVAPADAENVGFWSHVVRCVGVTAVLASAPLALGVWAFRHAFASASTWRSVGLGIAAGALAAATMSVACSNDGALHVLLGHGAMMFVGAAVGAVVGRGVTRA